MSVLRKTINLTLSGNDLVASDTDAGVQGENNAVSLYFAVPSDWTGLAAVMYVTNEHRIYDRAVAVDGAITLPLQQPVTKYAGRLYVHISGSIGADVRKTADCLLYMKSSKCGSIEAAPISETMLQQILTLIKQSGGDMFKTDYASGDPDNPNAVDRALYSDNLIKYTVGTGGMMAYQVAFISSENTIMAANAANVSHAGRIVGVLTAAGSEWSTGIVKTAGAINNPAWNLCAGSIYYLGSGGEIVSMPPTSGFVQKIGVAQSTTELFIQIEPPIILN